LQQLVHFKPFIQIFWTYFDNAGYLSEPLFKLLYLDYSPFNQSIQACDLVQGSTPYKPLEEITFGLRPQVALDNPVLGKHFSSVAGRRFFFRFVFFNKNEKFYDLWINESSGLPLANPTFDRVNTKLLSEVSLPPY